MAPGYQRTTTRADLSALAPGIGAALREYSDTHQLAITDDLPAWLTRSINPPSTSLFGKLFARRANPVDPDSEHQTLVVLHPTHLIVVVSGARRGTAALAAPLARATMDDELTDDSLASTGFTVTGFHDGPGSFHIGVGAPDGTQCHDEVKAAIIAAKNA